VSPLEKDQIGFELAKGVSKDDLVTGDACREWCVGIPVHHGEAKQGVA
jgi:hypothetical protein